MLADLDLALRALFRGRMTTLGAGTAPGVTEAQVGFQPPDDDWVTDISSLKTALNVYLADVRENRALRSNERVERPTPAGIEREPAPMRVACHYLITAWSTASDRKAKTLAEHGILAEALTVLADEGAVSVGGEELPTSIAPPDGFPKLAEFWGTMGEKLRWKPAIQLVVTIPVFSTPAVTGPAVTTRFTEYRRHPGGAAPELRMQIGGVVTDTSTSPATPVARAWVRLEQSGAPLQVAYSDREGRFTFLDVEPGGYSLRVRAQGRAEPPTTPITVPSASGRYDLSFP